MNEYWTFGAARHFLTSKYNTGSLGSSELGLLLIGIDIIMLPIYLVHDLMLYILQGPEEETPVDLDSADQNAMEKWRRKYKGF